MADKDLMKLPKAEVANMAIRARNVLRKNVTALEERKQAAMTVAGSFVGAGIMGYVNGMTRADAVVTRRGLPGAEVQGARLIGLRIGDLEFITVYCPNGDAAFGRDIDHRQFVLTSVQSI